MWDLTRAATERLAGNEVCWGRALMWASEKGWLLLNDTETRSTRLTVPGANWAKPAAWWDWGWHHWKMETCTCTCRCGHEADWHTCCFFTRSPGRWRTFRAGKKRVWARLASGPRWEKELGWKQEEISASSSRRVPRGDSINYYF